MQSCPNCGSETRDGAKFCTNCGLQFTDGNDTASSVGPAPADEPFQAWGNNPGFDDEREPLEGWPTPPSSTDVAGGGWGVGASSDVASEREATTESNAETAYWLVTAPQASPAAPNGPAADASAEPGEPVATARPGVIGEPSEAAEIDPMSALDLLDELRAAILAMGARASIDLRGVVSDLEVAVTPPGALPPDELAELRDALFAAREKPRDIDTIVDLTRRIDGLAALVIAYDRTIAAIERSLEVLRRTQDSDSHTSEEEDR